MSQQAAQDRLVKGLRQAGASSLEEANQYLEQVYLPLWNERFSKAPAQPAGTHRPLLAGQDLAAILSHIERRTVTRDYISTVIIRKGLTVTAVSD